MYTVYVIPGSHACRSALLMLDVKGVPYRRADLVTLLHPIAARLRGFKPSGERRTAAGRRTLALRSADMLATVPALAAGDERITTNHRIARFLDAHHPEPPLVPADPAVEAAERWANDELQMAARRIFIGAIARDPAGMARRMADGRLGVLLYRREALRRLIVPWIGRLAFAAGPDADRERLAELPAILDHVDDLIAAGVIGGDRPNVADCMIAPSLALILYRPDVGEQFAGRPALALVDRLLPDL